MKRSEAIYQIIESIKANAALPDECAEGTPPLAYISEDLLAN